MHRARRADLVVGLFERTVLHRVAGARYRDEGHGHRVIIEGRIAALRAPVRHDDRKPLQRWFAAGALRQPRGRAPAHRRPGQPLGRTDRLRRTGFAAPPLAFAYTLLVAGTLLDGWPSWFYALQRTVAEAMIFIPACRFCLLASSTVVTSGRTMERASRETRRSRRRLGLF